MGAPDLLAKHVFSEELPALFCGAVTFQPGMDLGLAELRLDGVLVVLQPLDLSSLLAPWSLLRRGFTVVEVKMPGDHTDEAAFERALLRRQALRVVLLERKPAVAEPVSLWMVAPHLPSWLPKAHRLTPCGPGCYRVEAGENEVLWIAANELPLDEALLPLLVARSGKKLAELVRWSLGKRSVPWVTRLLQWSSMSLEMTQELEAELKAYGLRRGETPEEKEVARRAVRLAMLMAPDVGEELTRESKADGLREGKADGLRDGLRTAVRDLCELLGIAMSEERTAYITSLDLAGLETLRAHLKAHKSWP
jgi:hypothetical protein